MKLVARGRGPWTGSPKIALSHSKYFHVSQLRPVKCDGLICEKLMRDRAATHALYTSVILHLCASISARWWAEGNRNGMFKHGLYTKDAVEELASGE